MSDFLPPVTAKLLGDISDYLAKMDQAAARMEAFDRSIPQGLHRQLAAVGEEGAKAGDQFSTRFDDKVKEKFKDIPRQVPPMGKPGEEKGAEFGGAFGEATRKRIKAALDALPKVNIRAESSDADVKVAALRAELEDLSREHIGITIDDKLAQAQMARIGAELKALREGASIPVKFDLDKAGKELDGAEQDIRKAGAALGGKGGKSFLSSFGESFAGIGAEMSGMLGPVLLAASPGIAAVLSAAVTTGLGLGFAGIGALALKSEPTVVNAFEQLEHDASSILKDAASPLAGPFVEGLKVIDSALHEIAPQLKAAFTALAPAIGPLAAGLAGLLKEMMPGITKAVQESAPVIEELGRQLPGFGAALGTLIKDLADAAPAAIDVIIVGFKTLDFVLRALGQTIKFLAGVVDLGARMWRGIYHAVTDVTGAGKKAIESLDHTGSSMGSVVGQAAKVVAATSKIRDVTDITAAMVETASSKQDKLANAYDRAAHHADGAVPALDNLGAGMDRVVHRADGATQPTAHLSDQLDRLTHHADGASPVLDRLGTSMDRVTHRADGSVTAGAQIPPMLDAVTHHADGAQDALINLADQTDRMTHRADGAAPALAVFAAKTQAVSHSIYDAGLNLADLQSKLGATAVTADQVAAGLTDKLLGSILGVKGATLSWHQALTGLDDTLHQNAHTFNENTKAGQQNMAALLQVVQANKALYDQNIANGMSFQQATVIFDQNTAALDRQLHKAGLTDKQIQQLTGDVNSIPDKSATTIAMDGLTAAINDLDDLIRTINHIPKNSTVTVRTRIVGANLTEVGGNVGGVYTQHRWGGIDEYHFAAGGLLSQAGIANAGTAPLVAFAEPGTGAEGWVPKNGIPSRSLAILNEMAGWYGASVIPRSQLNTMSSRSMAMMSMAQASPPATSTAPIIVQANLYLDGRQVHQALIPVAQQMKLRTGTTGLD